MHIQTYDGVAKPNTCLQDYTNAIEISNGNILVTVRYHSIMLAGTARAWIDPLPENTINSWNDMKEAFTKNFAGTYKSPHTVVDLQRCIHLKDESSWTFLARWITMKNGCESMSDETSINSFVQGLV
jgi:hypothetical protein